jgi:hypothetical protein
MNHFNLKTDDLSIWIFSMSNPSDSGVVVIPYIQWMKTNKMLTIMQFIKPDNSFGYINQLWEIQKEPFNN